MATPRKLTRDEVMFILSIEPEDAPVRGNALASGDDAADRACEDEIIARLDSGDNWAWCTVAVTARWASVAATEYLGCCSYADEKDFRQEGGYYEQLCDGALDRLNADIAARAAEIERLTERAEALFDPGDRVMTPGGPGVVVYRRMAPPSYSRADVYSVRLDAPSYTGTIYKAEQVTKV